MTKPSNVIVTDFSKWLEEGGKSLNTISTYQRELLKYQGWLHQYSIDLKEISQNDVQNYISFLEHQGKSPITIDKILGAIRTFAKFLKRPEIIMDIQIIPIDKKDEIELLSISECEQLLNQVKKDGNKRNIAIVYTLLHTGIRVSELCALNKSNLDFTHNQLFVYPAVGVQRSIPLSDEVKIHLINYLESANIVDALFISKSNERLTERSIQYMLKKYDVNPHKLRHTFCQRLVDNCVSLEVVSQLAGHKDINVTKRYAKTRLKQLELEKAIRNTFYDDTLG
ncbi:tyrosine-type recombinase/integrase [Pseudoneobacillus rhizosphaerae]|uniref:Tyrosine recombinase XerD n=1 Tax=Pseudoneobacillus rhizosphaerae TaxID=2880968 RepID=A0A9C7G879_9BACI|nr:tyrosine-type recombinase/integrase [Pseudoneobacillus rhizosphaerae]CAG9607528.1 Tyrosine recombinase XerD [Pseudoneobacillus rhizosphaerae]